MFPPTARLLDRLVACALWVMPTRAFSRLAFTIAEIRKPWLKNLFIRAFLRAYPAIDMDEAAEPDPERYACFNDFFTRELAAGTRPIPEDKTRLLCPVDGQLGMYGDIEAGQLGQIKGVSYDLHALLGGDDTLAATFLGGRYMTFYLAPHNYHRVHMPLDGRLRATRYIPGRLFGVNPRCVRSIPRLFTRNERLVCCFDTQVGPFALVLVGAFIVGGIQLRTAGRVCPPHRSTQRHTSYNNSKEAGGPFARGHPMGHFMLGSSVVILSAANAVDIDGELVVDQPVRLNQPLGGLVTESANPPLHCCPKGPSSQQPNRNNHVNLGTY